MMKGAQKDWLLMHTNPIHKFRIMHTHWHAHNMRIHVEVGSSDARTLDAALYSMMQDFFLTIAATREQ